MGNQGSAEQQAALLNGVDETLAVLAGRSAAGSSASQSSGAGGSGASKKISFTFNLNNPTSPRARKSTAAENSQTLPGPIPPSASRDSITSGSTSPRQVKFAADDSQKPASSPDSNPSVLSNAPAGFRSRFGSRRLASINITDIEAVRNKLAELTATMDIGQQVEMITGMEHRPAPAQPTEVDLIGDSDDDEETEADSAANSESGDADEDKDQPVTSREPSSSDADPAGPIDRSQLDRRASRRGGVFKQEDEKEVHRKEKKALVIQEIQASEHLYYKFLDIMINHYIKPLRDKKILTEAQISSIFSNIEVIAPYHKVIAQELEKEDAAEVYRRYASYLKVYTNYVTNYDKACDVVAALKSNQQFRQFLAEKRKDPACGGLDLMSFLIMPIQRIPRYPLLLSELKKYTSQTDSETSVLDDALEKVSFIANYVNEAKRMAVNRARILEIQNTVSGDFENLLQPGRFLVHDAMIYEKKKRSTKAHLYCFNDLLLWTNDSHSLSGMVNLATASLSEYKHKTKQGFVVSSPALDDGKVIFRCNTPAEKKLWMKHIAECLKAQQSTLLRSRDVRRQRSHAPLVTPPPS